MSEKNVETLRRGYEALNRGDVEAVLQMCDPDIECELPEGGITAGTLRGHQALKGFLEGWIESFEVFRLDPERFFDSDDRVVVFLHTSGRGRGSGLEMNARPAHVWTIKSGKAVRVQVFADSEREAALKAGGVSD